MSKQLESVATNTRVCRCKHWINQLSSNVQIFAVLQKLATLCDSETGVRNRRISPPQSADVLRITVCHAEVRRPRRMPRYVSVLTTLLAQPDQSRYSSF
ncbi:hypothetical protein SAMN06298226_2791 [Nitrosovibrio sp. Nv4]|nr:hypothetical protein SAMN06298226_2791 [Nitrosovibrio sp. Nv4]